MSWTILIPLLITLFAFFDAYETYGWYSDWWKHLVLALSVSAIAWLIWWMV